jgi:dephospho-CoA kinase
VVWPAMQSKLLTEIDDAARAGNQWIVVEAAVLAEAGWSSSFDEIWVVEVSTDIARTRLMARNNLTEDEANRRIQSQTSMDERRRIATCTIDNSTTLEASTAMAHTVR